MKKLYALVMVLAIICLTGSIFIGCKTDRQEKAVGDTPDMSISQMVDDNLDKLTKTAFLLGACYAQKAMADPRCAYCKTQYDVAELAWKIKEENQ